jgi:hypothetical protein
VGLEFPARIPNGDDFSMRCWIAIKDRAIAARAQYFVPSDDYCAKRPGLFAANLAAGQADRDFHITFMVSR